jgi:hypothetical protein
MLNNARNSQYPSHRWRLSDVLHFTQETPEALPAINAVLESSIGPWNLSDRPYQLSVNAYRYSESDWIDHQLYGLLDQNNTPLAIFFSMMMHQSFRVMRVVSRFMAFMFIRTIVIKVSGNNWSIKQSY